MARRSEGLYEDVAVLLSRLDRQEDPRDAYAIIQTRIREYRAAGWAVPDDLVRIERSYMAECMAQSQGR